MSGHEQRKGDYRVICDASGFLCWASETVRQWDGARVHRRYVDKRNPQDFVRSVRDNQSVPNPRPEQKVTITTGGTAQLPLILGLAPVVTTTDDNYLTRTVTPDEL